jgi:hypothetical protein
MAHLARALRELVQVALAIDPHNRASMTLATAAGVAEVGT